MSFVKNHNFISNFIYLHKGGENCRKRMNTFSSIRCRRLENVHIKLAKKKKIKKEKCLGKISLVLLAYFCNISNYCMQK